MRLPAFSDADLSVQIEDNQLVVRGKQTDDKERLFLHRGIAARQFQRAFVLAEGIEVTRASLDNGLLHVELRRPVAGNQSADDRDHTRSVQGQWQDHDRRRFGRRRVKPNRNPW